MNEYVALPFTFEPMPKVSYLLDRLVEHDGYWSDYQAGRREIAASLLTDPNNVLFEIWKRGEPTAEVQPVGLVVFTDIIPYVDCQFHPIFFDGKLANALGKRNILLSLLAWAFQRLRVERISVEIPEFAGQLIAYARKKLGFRFEAEGRIITKWTRSSRRRAKRVQQTPDAAQAAVGSRKHRIVRYHGEWHDLILLGVTRDEFAAFLASGLATEETHDGQLRQEGSTLRDPDSGPGQYGEGTGEIGVLPAARPPASDSAGPPGLPSGDGGTGQ